MTGRLKEVQCGGMTTKRFGGSDLLAPRGDNKTQSREGSEDKAGQGTGEWYKDPRVRYECFKQSCISDALLVQP